MYSNMDGPRDYHTKWSKSDRERQVYDITYMWNLKSDTNKLIYKTETDSQRLRKQTYGYQRGSVGGGINEEFGINIYTLLHTK